MSSDTEKLQSINTGDLVSWHEGSERQSGIVEGWHYSDNWKQHNVIIMRADRQITVALKAILSRQRTSGANQGFISWDPEQAAC